MKKFFLISFFFLLSFPLIALADGTYSVQDNKCMANYTVEYDGLVPCGRCLDVVGGNAYAWGQNECGSVSPPDCSGASIAKKFVPCTICHFFIILNDVANFIMLVIVPPIMVLIFTIAGIAFYQGGQSPQKISFAKKILTSATIGFALIYGSWLIINLILTSIGVSEWTGLGEGWFQASCQVIIK